MTASGIAFVVSGKPVPQGSMRSFGPRRMVVSNHQALAGWRADVREAAERAMRKTPTPQFPDGEGFVVALTFKYARPKSHFKANGELKESAPRFHIQMPDADKLARATLDALTGVFWNDDAQVHDLTSRKVWLPARGAESHLFANIGWSPR